MKGFLLLVLGVLSVAVAAAQPVKSQFSQQEVKQVNREAREKLKSLMSELTTLSTPDYDIDDRKGTIPRAFEAGKDRLFYTDKFEVDDDFRAENAQGGEDLLEVREYLESFLENRADGIFEEGQTEVSDIYLGSNYPFVNVFFTQYFKGKARDGRKLPAKRLKMAQMQIIPDGNSFQLLINKLNFANNAGEETARKATITGKIAGTADNTDRDQGYFVRKLERGKQYLQRDAFALAFYCFTEARRGPKETAEQADEQMQALKSRMRTMNLDINAELEKQFTRLGQQMEDNYRYDEALTYYTMVLEGQPNNYNKIAAVKQAVEAQAAKETPLLRLLDKEAWSEAQRKYEDALKTDPNNPNYYVGLARAYQGLGDPRNADTTLVKAIRLRTSNPLPYYWQARLLLMRNDFTRAYSAMSTYKTLTAEDALPGTDELLLYMAGVQLYRDRKIGPALDTLKACPLPEARIYEARIYKERREYDAAEAIVKSLLRSNPKNPDALYLKGQLLIAQINSGNGDKNREAAMQAFSEALSYNTSNIPLYLELATLQMQTKRYDDAVRNLTACIENNRNSPIIAAYWYRGKCQYQRENYADAYRDMQFVADSIRGFSPPPAFFIDYARVLTWRNDYDKAVKYLNRARDNNDAMKEALLGLGVISYLRNPADVDAYLKLFQDAFELGVSKEAVASDRYIARMYQNKENKRFRDLMKKYRYTSAL